MASGKYDGAILTQGSPAVEETAYWLNLLIDTTLPICGNAAQRPQGQISNDGPHNIVDSLISSAPKSGPMSKAATAPAWWSSRSNGPSPRARS
jgi:L-asparaginase/Glu-tRNA(Gln) amidotransferase subunit D